MANHSAALEQTAIWQTYISKNPSDTRRIWLEKIYAQAADWLTHVTDAFPNYTLHNEKHILNVLDAMGGILGNQRENLSVGECELLILAAALHDAGMVYSPAGLERVKNNRNNLNKYLSTHAPSYYGTAFDDLSPDVRQGYLRTLHPFRLNEVFAGGNWDFGGWPKETVPKANVIAVCQAHGEDEDYVKNNRLLDYLPSFDTDPRFCALLLRLGDILDFDDTRAPEILLPFTKGNAKSTEEFMKHLSSGGFVYPDEPTDKPLAYSAACVDPNVEHTIRTFLDWIDEELFIAGRRKRDCRKDWQRDFPFPRAVSRDEITREGYESDEFRLTMDQNQILNLLSGENLYEKNDIFVRELLQNAIDATLLRGKMDPRFDAESEDAAIYLWDGADAEGNLIFRIDDNGTGMTKGMLQRYFLKVGNSIIIQTS